MGETATTIVLVVILIAMLALSFLLQGWRTRRSPFGKAISVLKDIQYNRRLIESFSPGAAARRFRTDSWNRHSASLAFLPGELRSDLDILFAEFNSINVRIDDSIQLGSRGYAGDFSTGKLQTMLPVAEDKMRKWVYENMNNKALLPKKWGVFRF